jgi:hypothetical protein
MYEDWSQKHVEADRRQHPRYEYSGRVILGPVDSHFHQSGTIVDLSAGGCLIRLQRPASFALRSILEMNFQAGYHSFRATGTTTRHEEDDHLIAVKFQKIDVRGRIDLFTLLTHLEGSSGHYGH